MNLKLVMNFALMASENDVDYRVKLIDASPKIHKVKVNPSLSLAHEKFFIFSLVESAAFKTPSTFKILRASVCKYCPGRCKM